MSIEASAGGRRKYRQAPTNDCMVQVQKAPGWRWTDYAPRDTPKEAAALVLSLAQLGEDGAAANLRQAALAALGWLDAIYPPAIFDGSSGDEGAIEIVAIRENLRHAIEGA